MSFPYKNPISPSQLSGQQSLERSKTYGTNYSILSTGGYMEVFSINDLYYTIPPSTYGPIEFSGNSIPITFSKGSGTTFSYDTLTLHSDNISSGRKKLGMLVYVIEEDQVYQFVIDGYENLWNSATASTGSVIISEFGTTIKADSPENISLMSGWTANTIDGVSGETYSTAVWKKYYGNNLSVTGATFNSGTGTLTLTNITGGTQTLTGFGGGGGSGITGGTFDKNTETLTLSSSGGSIYITGFTDVYVTGGTYSSGSITFTNTSGGTFIVSGLSTGGGGVTTTGATYSNNTFTFTNSTGGTFDVSFNTLTGATIDGNLSVTGTTSSGIISATTYQNLPTDVYVTGGTYSVGTATFTNNTGGTFNVVGFFTGYTNVVSSLTTSVGLSGNSTTGNITLINTSPDQVVTLGSGIGISTSGTYPNFTITNSSPDQIVTISGGTGITTGGTYPNFTITNSDPDQVVTISGGTNISVTGTYPNFNVSFTGSTTSTFDYGKSYALSNSQQLI